MRFDSLLLLGGGGKKKKMTPLHIATKNDSLFPTKSGGGDVLLCQGRRRIARFISDDANYVSYVFQSQSDKGGWGGLVSPGRAKYGVEYPYLSPLFLGRTQLSTSLGVSERTPRPPISFTSLRVKLRILTKTFMKRGSVKKI